MASSDPPPPFTIIRLPPNGPKPGQSVEAWIHGKNKRSQYDLERLQWQALRSNKKGPEGP